MFRISKTIELDAGHRVPTHDGHCRFLHGHRYKIQATIDAPKVPDSGMVLDFGVLKGTMMRYIHAECDHRFLIWKDDPIREDLQRLLGGSELSRGIRVLPVIPTAENLAEYWYKQIAMPIAACDLQLKKITVWETPSSVAVYTPPALASLES